MPAITGMFERRGAGKAEDCTAAAPGVPIALIAATSGSKCCSMGDFHASTHCDDEMKNSSEPDGLTSRMRTGSTGLVLLTARSTSLRTNCDSFDWSERINTSARLWAIP